MQPDVVQRRSRRRKLVLAATALIAALFAWFWQPLNDRAVAETAYGARLACSCRYVSGRPLSDCRADLQPRIWPFFLGEDADEASVTAWVPLLASHTARWRNGAGCLLPKWEA